MCTFPLIEYVPNFEPLTNGPQNHLPKSPRTVYSTLSNAGIIPANFLQGIATMQDLERTIIDNIDNYPNNGITIERIFHLIEIWGGSAGQPFYTKNIPFIWADIEPIYQELVNTCLAIYDTNAKSRQTVFEACTHFQEALNRAKYKYMGVAYITKHTRFWLHQNLRNNTLPIYDSTFSIHITHEGGTATFNYLSYFWEGMIEKASEENISLLSLERQLFNYYQKKGISSYLSQYKEKVPEWLMIYSVGTKVSFTDILSGRVGYYPGSEYDRNLIEIGLKSQAVHSFLYVDYGISKKDLLNHLSKHTFIKGYHSIGRIEWEEKDIMPNGQYPLNIDNGQPINPPSFVDPNEKPYCITEIMERNTNESKKHSVERFAVTFLFADGIASYYQLFCREYKMAPWIVLLQDHGFGGNYDKFGKGGLLDAIIMKNQIRPEFVLCAENTPIWNGYVLVDGLSPTTGGMHHFDRLLFKNIL